MTRAEQLAAAYRFFYCMAHHLPTTRADTESAYWLVLAVARKKMNSAAYPNKSHPSDQDIEDCVQTWFAGQWRSVPTGEKDQWGDSITEERCVGGWPYWIEMHPQYRQLTPERLWLKIRSELCFDIIQPKIVALQTEGYSQECQSGQRPVYHSYAGSGPVNPPDDDYMVSRSRPSVAEAPDEVTEGYEDSSAEKRMAEFTALHVPYCQDQDKARAIWRRCWDSYNSTCWDDDEQAPAMHCLLFYKNFDWRSEVKPGASYRTLLVAAHRWGLKQNQIGEIFGMTSKVAISRLAARAKSHRHIATGQSRSIAAARMKEWQRRFSCIIAKPDRYAV